MIDQIYMFIAGALSGFGVMYYIATSLINQANAELRKWRNTAIRAERELVEAEEELLTLKETSK